VHRCWSLRRRENRRRLSSDQSLAVLREKEKVEDWRMKKIRGMVVVGLTLGDACQHITVDTVTRKRAALVLKFPIAVVDLSIDVFLSCLNIL
jgi:hypothetical protein